MTTKKNKIFYLCEQDQFLSFNTLRYLIQTNCSFKCFVQIYRIKIVLDKLKKYNKSNLVIIKEDSSLVKAHRKISNNEKQPKLDLVFINFSSAYNTINGQKLYQILRKNSILEDNEVTFLEDVHQNVYYQDPLNKSQKYSFQKGIIQASPIFLPLFNIYLDKFLNDLKQK